MDDKVEKCEKRCMRLFNETISIQQKENTKRNYETEQYLWDK